ncbi:hypothetical protein DIRU0_D05556 [Diutina rugosa]
MSFPNKKPRVASASVVDTPALHNVPDDFVPLVPPPHHPHEFFSDFAADADPRRRHQINKILGMFPPPVPPETSGGADEVKIPFIWPPPPVIRPHQLPYSMAAFRTNLEQYCRLTRLEKDRRKKKTPDDLAEYVPAPPLPFPPANFMPYPLKASEASLTPPEVVELLLNAKDHLPRVDMILASAAGQLVDYHHQVGEEGLDQEYYDARLAANGHGRRLRGRGLRGDADDIDFDGIDTRDYNEAMGEANYKYEPLRDWEYTQHYQKVKPEASYERTGWSRGSDSEVEPKFEPTDELQLSTKEQEFNSIKASNLAELIENEPQEISSNARDQRRLQFSSALDALDSHHVSHRDELFRQRKAELIERLNKLRSSRIHFQNSDISDSELASYDRRQSLIRDIELIRIWLERNYELLKASVTFYNDVNRVYRDYLQLMTNKLGKLHHFFQFQQSVLQHADHFDIRSRDSVKLYQGQVTTDYAALIKSIVKSHPKDTLQTATPEAEADDGIERSTSASPPPSKQVSSLTQLSENDTALVHDYMPLITPAEFSMITGDVARQQSAKGSSPNKQNPSLKHQIFSSSLYDPVTSGSDTNASDSVASPPAVGVPRRGRRTATPSAAQGGPRAADGVSTQHTEATLLAKIMKHFVGPNQATNDEYNSDLDQMHIDSVWPKK